MYERSLLDKDLIILFTVPLVWEPRVL
jgi:hypothetical protein